MKVFEIVRRVRETAGDLAVNQFSNSTLTDWINDAIREICIDNSLLQKSATSSLVVNQAEYTLPTDIIKLHSVTVDNTRIAIMSLQEWEARSDVDPETSTDSGTPAVGYVWAGKIVLYPPPSAIKSLRINYISDAGDIVYDGSGSAEADWTPVTPVIPSSYHARIVTYCLAQVALQDDDFAKHTALMADFKAGVMSTRHIGEAQEDLYPSISVSPRDMGGNFDALSSY